MKIVIDSREDSKNPKIKNALINNNVIVTIEELEAGDFYLPGEKSYVIERKTSLDLVHSIRSRRLWEQLSKMSNVEDARPILLVEQPLTLIEKFTKWSVSSVCSILASVQLSWNVSVLYAPNRKWTISYLLSLLRNLEKSGGKIHPIRMVPKDRPLSDIQRGIVEGFPGISSVKADALLRYFGTPRRLFTATSDELIAVEGIGNKIADEIKVVLDSKYKKEVN